MVAIDTSAIIAILFQENDAESITRAIIKETSCLFSAASLLEAGIILQARHGDEGARDLDLLLYKLGLKIESVTDKQANIARKAYKQFGKGIHPAGLNYGDCFSYALAKEKKLPLLFKGNDFGKTDIQVAEY